MAFTQKSLSTFLRNPLVLQLLLTQFNNLSSALPMAALFPRRLTAKTFLACLWWTLSLSVPSNLEKNFLHFPIAILFIAEKNVKSHRHLATCFRLGTSHVTPRRRFHKDLSTLQASMCHLTFYIRLWIWKVRSLNWQRRSLMVSLRLLARLCRLKKFDVVLYRHQGLLLRIIQNSKPEITQRDKSNVRFLPRMIF